MMDVQSLKLKGHFYIHVQKVESFFMLTKKCDFRWQDGVRMLGWPSVVLLSAFCMFYDLPASSLVIYDHQTLIEIGGYFDQLKCNKLMTSPPAVSEMPSPPPHPPETLEKTGETQRPPGSA